jgi:hypothetical protein
MNKDINDIFSDEMENEIMSEIKKKRSKLNIKLIIAATFSTIIILVAGILIFNFASTKYIKTSFEKDSEKQELEYSIMYPNEYIGKYSCRETGYFKFESTFEYGKRLGSKVIYAGSESFLGGLSKNGVSAKGWKLSKNSINVDINKRYSNVYGLRKLHFLYPYVQYGKEIYEFEAEDNKTLEKGDEEKINDFHYLNEMDDNKIVEMALSFDKDYIYEDVNKEIDEKLITFYWVDNNSAEEKQKAIETKVPDFNAVGIKANDGSGELEEGPNNLREHFKEAVRKLKEIGDTKYVENIDENNFRISGVVVVGTPKELMSIQKNPMIKHAILGTVVDKY